MGRRTCALHKGKIYTWTELLEKFNIEHVDGVSAHTEWDTACSHKKLPKIEVVYWDEVNKEPDKRKIEYTKQIEKERNDNINFNFRNLILNSEVHNLLMNLKVMDENTNINNYRYVVLDKTDISILNNNNLNKISDEINKLFIELNKPFQSNPNKSSTVIQIFRTGNNNYKKSETQNNNLQIPSGYIDYNPTPDRKTRTCALLNNEILQWTDLLSKYNLNHVDGRSAHTEWDEYFKCKKDLPYIKVVYRSNDDDYNNVTIQPLNNIYNNNENGSSRITKRHREFVWNRDVGNSKSGKCYTCNRVITDDNFETGHIIAKSKGGSSHVSNLRAICIPCNRSMGTMNLEEFKKDFE